MTVGNVKGITINPEGNTVVVFQVVQKYSDKVRWDTQASIGFMGLLGEKSLDLTAGSPEKPPIPPQGQVASIEPLDITQMLAKAAPSLENLQKILDNIATLTDSLVGKEGGLSKTMTTPANHDQINRGQGTVGLIVNDPKLYRETTETITAARKVFADLEQGKGALGTLAKDPQFKAQMQKTMENLEAGSGNLNKSSADFKKPWHGCRRLPKNWTIS